ncbi:MAG: inorganic phosphate transporter [Oscillospiraceae bacterium]|jgi:PiT family inorganic phosphate transporter|nr:inorganic phosphate transporter [Oscillospiraceae bacterium]
MTITFSAFLHQLISNPPFLITVVLILSAIVVNGGTDAPNAIATCVSTRSMSPRAAVLMAAGCNLLGIIVMTRLCPTVAETIYKMVDFGHDTHSATIALCAAMIAIVVWGAVAWKFGIPTSQSHSLIAGLTGAAIAVHNGLSGVNGSEWVKVLYGLALSAVLGFGLGWFASKLTGFICRNKDRRKTAPFFRGAQIFGGAIMAFMHGAQDGQKFISVLLMGLYFAVGMPAASSPASGVMNVPTWMMVLCAVVMATGTAVAGSRIIKSVGMNMVKLERYQGFAANMAGAVCLLISNLTGWPVSTTHTNTTAIMGVGAAKRISAVNWGVAKSMALTWILTFPGCGLIGYAVAKICMMVL